MRRRLRVIAGFLIAPAIVPVATMIFFLVVDQKFVLPSGFISAFFAYAGMGVFGLPAYLLLSKRGIFSLPIATVVGSIAGPITWYAFMVMFGLSLGNSLSDVSSNLSDAIVHVWAIVTGAFGIAVGIAFWFIARPDRTISKGIV